jgi:hypothetical protein
VGRSKAAREVAKFQASHSYPQGDACSLARCGIVVAPPGGVNRGPVLVNVFRS